MPTESESRILVLKAFHRAVKQWWGLVQNEKTHRVLSEAGLGGHSAEARKAILRSEINHRMSIVVSYVEQAGAKVPLRFPGDPGIYDPFTALLMPALTPHVVEPLLDMVEVAIGFYEVLPDLGTSSEERTSGEVVETSKLITKLAQQIPVGEAVLATKKHVASSEWSVDTDRFAAWGATVVALIDAIFGKQHPFYENATKYTRNNWRAPDAEQLLALVRAAVECARDGVGVVSSAGESPSPSQSAVAIVERLCDRFPLVVRELRKRYGRRKALLMKDEYDVQDLLRALLKISFDDVRAEDAAPSRAGASTRIDFVLPKEGIGVEIKMARKGLTAKKLGEELIIDIERYQSRHRDCRILVCFVYDPAGLIHNPRGIERDLSGRRTKLAVRVRIRPHA